MKSKMLDDSSYFDDQENEITRDISRDPKNISSLAYEKRIDPTTSADSANAVGDGSIRAPICANCHNSINDPYVMRVHPDFEYHAECLMCCCCKRLLNETCTTFVRSNKIYCRDDYYKKFGKRCTRCNNILLNTDQIFRVRLAIFHLQCFSCLSCEKRLNCGDYYIMREDNIFCKQECLAAFDIKMQHDFTNSKSQNFNFPVFATHHRKNFIQSTSMPEPLSQQPIRQSNSDTELEHRHMQEIIDSFDYQSTSNSLQFDLSDDLEFTMPEGNDGLQRQIHSSMSSSSSANSPYSNPESVTAPSSINSTGCLVSSGVNINSGTSTSTTGSMQTHSKKNKKDKPAQRIRTVLNDKQLKILKQMYSSNQRPDQALKEKLSEMTGLNSRVIRVWFQNKRCKDKKKQNAIKEFQQNQEKEQTLQGVRLNGVGPLVAESPITFIHDSIVSSSALKSVNIRAFQQNSSLWESNLATDTLSPFVPLPSASSGSLMDIHQRPVMTHDIVHNDNNNGDVSNAYSSLPSLLYGNNGTSSSEFLVSSPTLLESTSHHSLSSIQADVSNNRFNSDDHTFNTFLSCGE